jgi:hypothetical protein
VQIFPLLRQILTFFFNLGNIRPFLGYSENFALNNSSFLVLVGGTNLERENKNVSLYPRKFSASYSPIFPTSYELICDVSIRLLPFKSGTKPKSYLDLLERVSCRKLVEGFNPLSLLWLSLRFFFMFAIRQVRQKWFKGFGASLWQPKLPSAYWDSLGRFDMCTVAEMFPK